MAASLPVRPFAIGGPELADLRRAIENVEKLFVFSERRYGKTSLVHAVLRKLPRMVLDKNRPLYRASGHYPLGPIQENIGNPSSRNGFLKRTSGSRTSKSTRFCEMTQVIRFTRRSLSREWEMCEAKATVTVEMIRAAVTVLLDRETYTYTTLWESLTASAETFPERASFRLRIQSA